MCGQAVKTVLAYQTWLYNAPRFTVVVFILVSQLVWAESAQTDDDLTLDTDSVVANIQTLSPFEAEQEKLKQLIKQAPKSYKDKVMDNSTLQALSVDEAQSTEEPDGFKMYTVETRAAWTNTQMNEFTTDSLSAGTHLDYQLETQNYGDVQVQADTSIKQYDATWQSSKNHYEKLSVRNRNLPLSDKLMADTELGDIVSRAPSGFARSSRIGLGNSSVRGVGTRITGDKFEVVAGTGKRGYLIGEPYAGYKPSDGNLTWAGYSQSVGQHTAVAAQFSHVDQIQDSLLSDRANAKLKVDSLALGANYAKATDKTEINASALVLHSQTRDSQGNTKPANGVMVDASVKRGKQQHSVGVYSSQRDLRYAESSLPASQGVYWRWEHQSARQSIGTSVEVEQIQGQASHTDNKLTRLSTSANASYQLERGHSLGASLQLTQSINELNGRDDASNQQRAANLTAYYQGRWQNKRSQVNVNAHYNDQVVANAPAATGYELQWEQDWLADSYTTMRPELSSTLGVAVDKSQGDQQVYPTAGIRGRYWLDADWSVGGSLRYTSRTGNLATSQGLAGSVNTEYELGKGWSLGGSVNLNQATVDVNATRFSQPLVSRTTDKSAYVYVRWQGTRGKPYQAVGKASKGKRGTGSIQGLVFFDKNRDGIRQVDEMGIPQVEVVLDDGYRVTTDQHGQFNMPTVWVGEHTVSLDGSTIPLPWEAPNNKANKVKVVIRSTKELALPLYKIGE
jgi:hypothetical protein